MFGRFPRHDTELVQEHHTQYRARQQRAHRRRHPRQHRAVGLLLVQVPHVGDEGPQPSAQGPHGHFGPHRRARGQRQAGGHHHPNRLFPLHVHVFHFAEDPFWLHRKVHEGNQLEAADAEAGAGGHRDPPQLPRAEHGGRGPRLHPVQVAAARGALVFLPAPEPCAARPVEEVEEPEAREAHEAALQRRHDETREQKIGTHGKRFAEYHKQVKHLLIRDGNHRISDAQASQGTMLRLTFRVVVTSDS
mmetsp:Transcript_75629/g.148131  ORF Transcript_75629/g.148131 Transcript_75629/m.148131 type:complete len:247 (-) Transcript_75629:182-922(-)